MIEHHTPLLVEVEASTNINALLVDRAAHAPDRALIEYKRADGSWSSMTARDVLAEVTALAQGLLARGIRRGDRVGIMARTSREWALLDWAIWSAGAVTVPIYETSSAEQVEWIVRDAAVRLLIVEDEHHAAIVDEARETGTAPDRENVLCLHDGALETLREAGRSISDDELASRRRSPRGNDLATIIYTSGTTGRPKGVELTHHNFVALVLNSREQFHEIVSTPGARTLLFIPLAHVFARFVHVLAVPSGTVVGYVGDAKTLVADMQSFRPTYVLGVPRVFEKLYNGADLHASQHGKQKIFRWAAAVAVQWSRMLDSSRSPTLSLRLRKNLADLLVLRKIRALLGNQASWAISGGAALGERLHHFFRGAGITVLEGYGLTETTAPITLNAPRAARLGTVGQLFPGCSARTAPDGEVQVRGPGVFQRYHANPEATADAFQDGWFRTGDLGSIDEDGYLKITGRKKELLVTASGKNVAPAVLEDRLRAHPLISQCVVVGDARPFIAVLVTLDVDALPDWLRSKSRDPLSLPAAATDPDILAAIERAITRTNAAVSRAESIRAVRILSTDFTTENGYLTPSLKVKRDLVLRDYANIIDEIYHGSGSQRPGPTGSAAPPR